ncbi:MAG TPA: YggS family pyridoxal phosphate-dependent enzyme [Gemmatimonadaceae bacterium]
MPFPGIADRVQEVRQRIEEAVQCGGHGQAVRIVAVTKTYGPEAAEAAWQAGIGIVGENRIQEALDKMDRVSEPVEWHLIGHLQRNKVKHLDRFALFHALDSERLAVTINDRASAGAEVAEGAERRRMPVLVQVNTSGEETKGGFSLSELRDIAPRLAAMRGLDVRGAMTMAPFDAPEHVLRQVFGKCRDAGALLRDAGMDARELSMGMSGDYEVAVEEGATMVRLGTILFGARMP